VRAIHAAAAGEAIFGPGVAHRIIEHFTHTTELPTSPVPTVTARERDVLDLIATGRGNAAIAHDLMISLKTVSNHVSNVLTELQVPDRSAAIVKARNAGLGQ